MKATVIVHNDFVISKIDDRIYSAFLEHLGRAIYTGIYEPDHVTADLHGMRGDVASLVRALNIPYVRYPGGNFVSAYNWEDGRLAAETAKTLCAFDKSLELVVCGSSNSDMKTYPEWERVVLEHTYESVDHISLHMYFANRTKNTANYLALNHKLDTYIATIASTINLVKANKRSKRKVTISFDEWNSGITPTCKTGKSLTVRKVGHMRHTC